MVPQYTPNQLQKWQQPHITDSPSLQLDQLQNNPDMTVHNVNTIATTQDKMLTQNEASYTPMYAQVPCQCQPAPPLLLQTTPYNNKWTPWLKWCKCSSSSKQHRIWNKHVPNPKRHTVELRRSDNNVYSGATRAAPISLTAPTSANGPQSSATTTNFQGQQKKIPKEAMTCMMTYGWSGVTQSPTKTTTLNVNEIYGATLKM